VPRRKEFKKWLAIRFIDTISIAQLQLKCVSEVPGHRVRGLIKEKPFLVSVGGHIDI
jgi:hypothetical protein